MRHLIIIGLIAALVSGMFYTQKAEAIDPVTIAILAPIALKAAKIAAPYVIRGLKCGAVGMLEMGVDVLKILLLPLGVLEVVLLWPFGLLQSGFGHIVQGGWAPFALVGDTLLLPLRFCGIDV